MTTAREPDTTAPGDGTRAPERDTGAPEDPATGPGGTASGSRTALTDADDGFLGRAAELGRRGWGRVHPNPMVGCVLVREGAVVGEGWHDEFGGPHAEIRALREAGEQARGATAYVSLEPCDHLGKTPPCTEALLHAGVSRVVYGAADPGAESGGGARTLRDAGVEVAGPVFSPETARELNPSFFHNAETASTYVALKLAMSLDGKIAEAPGRTTRLTGPESAAEVHRLRRGFAGILVGAGTARTDDPRLTVREGTPPARPPARLVVDSRAELSPGAALFEDVDDAPVVVFCRTDAPETAIEALEGAGATVHPVPPADDGVDLGRVLEICWETGIHSVLCEGGGRLASSLLGQGRVRRLYLFVAPRVVGPEGVPAFPGPFGPDAWDGWRALEARATFGPDALVVFDREA